MDYANVAGSILNRELDLTDVMWGLENTSTGGVQPKAIIDGDYYKLNTWNLAHGFYGREALAESIASAMARAMQVDAVNYKIRKVKVRIDGIVYSTIASVSKDFKSDGCEYISFRRLLKQNIGKSPIEIARMYPMLEDVYKMIIFDFIIYNLDRHENNVELNTSTMRLAPLFDHGLSFGLNTGRKDFEEYTWDMEAVANNVFGDRNLRKNLELIDYPTKVVWPTNLPNVFNKVRGYIPKREEECISRNIYLRLGEVRRLSNVVFTNL